MANDWFMQNLGDPMLAINQQEQVKALVAATCAGSEHPNEMAAFIRHESEGRLHCDVKVFFSPSLSTLAKKLGAIRCRKPQAEGLSLLAGCEDSWPILFPEHRS
jgi:hypothetical protein